MTQQNPKPDDKLIPIAEIVGAHGVRGQVKIKVSSDDPARLPEYGVFYDASRKTTFKILEIIQHGSIWLAALEGVQDRTAAEKLHGTKLYIERARLPDLGDSGAFYHSDLIGMKAQHADGTPMGTVINVVNFGAGDLLDIKPPKGASFYIQFTQAYVPQVDMETKTVTVIPPEGWLE